MAQLHHSPIFLSTEDLEDFSSVLCIISRLCIFAVPSYGFKTHTFLSSLASLFEANPEAIFFRLRIVLYCIVQRF